MTVVSTGEQSIEDGKVVAKVTKPNNGSAKTVAVKVGKNVRPSPDGRAMTATLACPAD